ncbi:MAG: hypothetical protein ACK5HP_04890 [Bacilli bacterium]
MLEILAKCSIDIDPMIPSFTIMVINLFKVIIPIILIMFGMIDMGKAVMSNDEKVMKTAQTTLIKRIIYAVIIFFIVAIVQLVFGMLANAGASDGEDMKSCISCFVSDIDHCKNQN